MTLTLHGGVAGQHYAGPDSVTRKIAEALGRTPGGVHQMLDGPEGLFAKVERVLSIAVTRGHTAWAATRVERLARIVRQARVPLTPQLVVDAQAADMAEDIAETKYLAQPTAEHRDEWVRALDKSILKLMALRDAAVGA